MRPGPVRNGPVPAACQPRVAEDPTAQERTRRDRGAANPDDARLAAVRGTFACLAAGLGVALALVRRLTLGVLAEGALGALLYLGFAVLGLVISLRLPGNPIG
jgi:hypothetical protein